jgi:hypothetical protein
MSVRRCAPAAPYTWRGSIGVAFTVNDFRDLIDLLEQHPEWRAELRRHVLSEEILELPALVRQLVETQAQTEVLVRQLVEAQARAGARLNHVDTRLDRMDQRFDQIDQRFDQIDQRLDQIDQRLDRMDERFDRMDRRFDRMDARLGKLDGRALEVDYERQAPSYFGSLVGRLRVVQKVRLAGSLDDAIDEGLLTGDEREEIMRSDLVVSGRRRTDGQDVLLLAEISVTVDPHDVERAAERAGLLAKLGKPVVPVVGGESITDQAAALAHERGVWYAQGGTLSPPRDA